MDIIYITIDKLMKEGGVEHIIKQSTDPTVRKEREEWLETLTCICKQLKPTDEKELKFINREISLLRRRLGISMTIDDLRNKWKIRNKRAYEKKKKAKLDGTR